MKWKMEFTADQIFEKPIKQCMHCTRNTTLPNEEEYTCFSSEYKTKQWNYKNSTKEKNIFLTEWNMLIKFFYGYM